MAPGSERAATPTNVTPGLAAATALTDGTSALQNGHHGVQNHSTAGLPARLEPLKGAPAIVDPVNCMRSSARAVGGLPNTSTAIMATIASRNHPRDCDLAASMVRLPPTGKDPDLTRVPTF